jgi:hypothetical protein
MADDGALPHCMSAGWRRITSTATFAGKTSTFSARVTGRAELRLDLVLRVTRPVWRRLLGIPSKATVHIQPRIIFREPCTVTQPLLVKGRLDG